MAWDMADLKSNSAVRGEQEKQSTRVYSSVLSGFITYLTALPRVALTGWIFVTAIGYSSSPLLL